MTVDQVNYLNIFLMLLSGTMAFYLPFEVFILAYAVLGPLHYLTQISWLHDRKYFSTGKYDPWLLVLLAIPTTLSVLKNGYAEIDLVAFLGVVAFGTAISLAFVASSIWKLICILCSILLALLLRNLETSLVIFGMLLPTVIHVYVFTGIFILFGSLKGKSVSGYLSCLVYLACPAFFLLFPHPAESYTISQYVQAAVSPFSGLIYYLGQMVRLENDWNGAVTIGRFLAFAYTYHYLNWFSKTNVIGWGNITKQRMLAIITLYCLSLVIYALDYKLGFITLFFLSLLHVFLEFPLNHRSIVGTFGELRGRLTKS